MDSVLAGPFTPVPMLPHSAIPGFAAALEGILTPEECAAIIQIVDHRRIYSSRFLYRFCGPESYEYRCAKIISLYY